MPRSVDEPPTASEPEEITADQSTSTAAIYTVFVVVVRSGGSEASYQTTLWVRVQGVVASLSTRVIVVSLAK